MYGIYLYIAYMDPMGEVNPIHLSCGWFFSGGHTTFTSQHLKVVPQQGHEQSVFRRVSRGIPREKAGWFSWKIQ